MQSKREPNDVGLPQDRKRRRTGKLALAACSRCRHLKRRVGEPCLLLRIGRAY